MGRIRKALSITARIPHAGALRCVDSINERCHKAMGNDVDATLVAARCDCQVHHSALWAAG